MGQQSNTCVARRMSNLPRGSVLRCSKPNTPFSEPSCTTTPPLWPQSQFWKALVLSSWLLLGRPTVSASDSNCAHFPDSRLELFWAQDWSALWAMVRAECDVAPVHNTTRRTDKQQMQSRVRKATLARIGEKGRGLAAARNAPPVPVAEQIVQEIKGLHPADPQLPALAQAFVSGLFLSEVAEHVPTTLRKMPRLSEPGPLGIRAEHWYDFGSLAGDSDLSVQVIAHIAAVAVPNPVLQYLKVGQITPLAKPTGGHIPLFMTSVSQSNAAQYRANRCGSCLLQMVHRHHGAQNALRFCVHQKSVPTVGWIRVIFCQRVDSQ